MSSLVRVHPELRRVRAADLEFIARLSDGVLRRYDERVVRNVLRMVKNPQAQTLVAALGDEPIGFVVVRFQRLVRDYGPWAQPVVAHLDVIAVRREHARRGVGARLLAGAEHVARRYGAVAISLLTAVDNESAKRLFDRAGFQLVVAVDDVYAGGRRALAMQKGLRAETAAARRR